jgi:hypothetical protein
MYLEKDGVLYLPVKQSTYDDLWMAVNDTERPEDGFTYLKMGQFVIAVDTPEFRKWIADK